MVHVTDGRTFKIRTHFRGTYVDDDLVVPNGKWVLERPQGCFAQLIGIDLDKVERFILEYKGYLWHTRELYVSDQPFGFVTWEYADEVKMADAESLEFVSARQIHKGELGQHIPIPEVPFTPERILGPKEGATNGDRQRARMGWVRLVDLTWATGLMAPILILNRYMRFGTRGYSFALNEPSMELVVASLPDVFDRPQFMIEVITRSGLSRLIAQPEVSVADVWVRRGFANTVLRLIALGFIPEPVTA